MTKMTETTEIDDLFADMASAPAPELSETLTARLLHDAERLIPAQAAAPELRGWRGIVAALGGWPTLGGLATAAAAGVWVGFVSPSMLSDLTAGLTGDAVTLSVYTDTAFAEIDG